MAMESISYNYIYPYNLKVIKKLQRAIEKKENNMSVEERELLKEIEEAHREMITSFNHFNNTIEPGLIEYYIYQYKAAQIKYDYLLRCIKELYYTN